MTIEQNNTIQKIIRLLSCLEFVYLISMDDLNCGNRFISSSWNPGNGATIPSKSASFNCAEERNGRAFYFDLLKLLQYQLEKSILSDIWVLVIDIQFGKMEFDFSAFVQLTQHGSFYHHYRHTLCVTNARFEFRSCSRSARSACEQVMVAWRVIVIFIFVAYFVKKLFA